MAITEGKIVIWRKWLYLFPVKGEIISIEKVPPVDTLIHICHCGLEEEAGNEELQAQTDGWME